MKIKKLEKKDKSRVDKYTIPLYLGKIDWQKTEQLFQPDKTDFITKIKHKVKINPKAKEILKLLAGGALIATSMVIPVLPMAIAPFVIDQGRYKKGPFGQVIRRLKRQKLIHITKESGQTVVRITQRGRIRALRYKLDEMNIKKPNIWDKKWRVIIFDIPERYKPFRELFRKQLQKLGFYQLQRSVYVHAFPCFDEVEFIRQIFHVAINVTYIKADTIENSQDLHHQFHPD